MHLRQSNRSVDASQGHWIVNFVTRHDASSSKPEQETRNFIGDGIDKSKSQDRSDGQMTRDHVKRIEWHRLGTL